MLYLTPPILIIALSDPGLEAEEEEMARTLHKIEENNCQEAAPVPCSELDGEAQAICLHWS